jgi:hypothetical protein
MSKRFQTICKGLALALVIGIGVATLVQFPDEPLAPCQGPGGYCGKQGQPHTAADYSRYRDWTTAQFAVLGLGLIGLVIIERGKPKP